MVYNKANMYVEEEDIIELMLQNRQVKILPRNTESFQKFNDTCKNFGIHNPFELSTPMTDQLDWNLPEEYKSLDIKEYIKTKLPQTESKKWSRVNLELAEFEQRNLTDLLKFLVYFVDALRKNNIIYGVGRGSSVASYVLYLLGVHRVDSFKYNLDIKEFLK